MAHHQNGKDNRGGGLLGFITSRLLSSTVAVPVTAEEDLAGEADEPPDDRMNKLTERAVNISISEPNSQAYKKSKPPMLERRESLLTRALHSPDLPPLDVTSAPHLARSNRGLSGISIRSNASASTTDLTSDSTTSPARTTTPSPPHPSPLTALPSPSFKTPSSSQITIVDSQGQPVRPQEPVAARPTENIVEANLGRKRCIRFACGKKSSPKEEPHIEIAKPAQQPNMEEPPKRKSMLTFACPMRSSNPVTTETAEPTKIGSRSPPPTSRENHRPTLERRASSDASSTSTASRSPRTSRPGLLARSSTMSSASASELEKFEATRFHEFAGSHEEEDEWLSKDTPHKDKMTVNDCLKKENAIRQLGEEAEQEALEEEEDELEAIAEEDEENDDEDEAGEEDMVSIGVTEDEEEDEEDNEEGAEEDDISQVSDGGNETDNEEGFADSDDESDEGSVYDFWTPAPTTAATSVSGEHIRPASHRTASISSIESTSHFGKSRAPTGSRRVKHHRKQPRPITPDLPDSTDFVCGTLDEDRPLEAAYKSRMEERRRAKAIVIPQDIDPSFPTTDPEDAEEDEVSEMDDDEEHDQLWIKGQLDGYEEDTLRGRRKSSVPKKRSPKHSPTRYQSPPPKIRALHHSPPPRRLFNRSPKRQRSPAPVHRPKSPASSRRVSAAISPSATTSRIHIPHLAERPRLTHTKSLPRTPNPFFHHHNVHRRMKKSPTSSTAASAATSPKNPAKLTDAHHIRGPTAIRTGLEVKRQKRKEKFWRQHCRKAAKEQLERRPVPGRGAERMRELGLEVAERTRGYGLGQKAEHILSL